MSVTHCSFSAFWRPENAFSAPSSTGFIKTMIFDIIVMGLEISAKTTSFSMYSKFARVIINEFQFFMSCISVSNVESLIYVVVS